jgi:hypothetical protein
MAEQLDISFLERQRCTKEEKAGLSGKIWFLLQDNARPHTAKVTTDAITEIGGTPLEHPPYSTDQTLLFHCSTFSRSGLSVARSASLAKGGTTKKRPSPHLHEVPTLSNKVSPRTSQTTFVFSTEIHSSLTTSE